MRRTVSVCLTAALIAAAVAVLAPAAGAKVLLVGTYHGKKGQFKTIEAAAKVAKRGDWILVAPGDYKIGFRQQSFAWVSSPFRLR